MIRIVSGGQTGVDRASLDAAIVYELPHCGWCPKGRLAEDDQCLTEKTLITKVLVLAKENGMS